MSDAIGANALGCMLPTPKQSSQPHRDAEESARRTCLVERGDASAKRRLSNTMRRRLYTP